MKSSIKNDNVRVSGVTTASIMHLALFKVCSVSLVTCVWSAGSGSDSGLSRELLRLWLPLCRINIAHVSHVRRASVLAALGLGLTNTFKSLVGQK